MATAKAWTAASFRQSTATLAVTPAHIGLCAITAAFDNSAFHMMRFDEGCNNSSNLSWHVNGLDGIGARFRICLTLGWVSRYGQNINGRLIALRTQNNP